jgi:hypothetical protein
MPARLYFFELAHPSRATRALHPSPEVTEAERWA